MRQNFVIIYHIKLILVFGATLHRNTPMKNHWIADSYCYCEKAYLQCMKLQRSIILMGKNI